MKIYLCILLTAMSLSAIAQRMTLSGTVRDATTGETLIGAVVSQQGTSNGVPTNSYGFYSLSVNQGKNTIVFSYVGYKTLVKEIDFNGSVKHDVALEVDQSSLEEVVVSASARNKNITTPQMGSFKFSIEEIKNVPVLFGEKDLLKTIQLLPGVQSGGEGSANFFVRGGGGDQNLILLDEAIVYNASHLLGFFSTFNSDAVKDVQFYKGGIPSQYGGRISSVMDITMVDGNQKKLSAEGGLGLIASRLKLSGPLPNDRGSFMISGRRTYADLFLKLSDDPDINQSNLFFYDLNAKLNVKINDRNRLLFSGYFGKDDLGFADRFGFNWGNSTATVRWNHILSDRLFSNTSFIYSTFNYNVGITGNNGDFDIASKIGNWNVKQDFSFYPSNRSTWRFGFNALRQTVSPASLDAQEGANVNSIEIEKRNGLDISAYISHDWKPWDKLSIIYGLRFVDFMVLGPGTFYSFDNAGEVLNERAYTGNSVLKHYFNLEPRISASYLLNSKSSIKGSYNRLAQNLHQLTNSTSALPTDQYVLSSLNIKPQLADQFSIGYFRNFNDNNYEFSVESYYKKMANQIDFKTGADLQANTRLEAELLYGRGRSYGLEFFLRKSSGKLNGWVSYTLSKSERQFDGINNGTWFNARQDRTHDLSIVAMYRLADSWTLGTNFIFNTGNAVTYPAGKYTISNTTLFYYNERNANRFPNYHRLDISATYERLGNNNRYGSSWTFGLYNAYNRRNAYLIDFRESELNPAITEAYKIALFGIIPSITWNFKF
ncbi:TonB-dependent receptor [Sphingobacterium bambusae]|uniref:Carboxypeptidase-like regulatory domain-containing protein n=2 Tax=Sphingobacterium bambusae TaxID=662858 RepID=A0ABW6BEA4_9SPHI|nr:TonB-dependent receptor [Sphingobacterium bambusae]WPL48568.1 TonB-dependent receptor [Sphingobacterium bambusae]